MFQTTSSSVGQVQNGGVFRPIWNTKKGVVLFCDAHHVVHEGLEPLLVGLVPPAIPPLEMMNSTVDVVREGRVRIGFHDAVKKHVSAGC